MKICIVFGGTSSERNISLLSGKAISESLSKNYNISTYDFGGKYTKLLKYIKNFDLIFNALHGGEGEDGTIQEFFEQNNIKFTGSPSAASKIAMNKHLTKKICLENNIPTPDWIYLENAIDTSKINKFNNKSIVIKPSDEGSSIGLSIINSFHINDNFKMNELNLAIKKCSKVSNNIIIEEYIDGREITVGILGNSFLPILEIVPDNFFYDYECKYSKGKSRYIVPAIIDTHIIEKLQNYSMKIFNLLNCKNYARVDFRLSNENEIYFLEINTLPGFTETSLFPEAAKSIGLSHFDLLEKIIQ